ncbi:MAG: YeeE/YedE thiosulfate transporter family protein, partial [Paracoccaceae bacterium]
YKSQLHKEINAIFWSAVVAIAIVSGWYGTYWMRTHGFEPWALNSHTFAAPVGETIMYSMNGSAIGLSFGIGSVFGVLIGAFIGSIIKGHFRWEACEDPRELRRQIIGATIMGAGAVIALGCSVGQGLTAFSVLSFSAPVTVIAIYIGARLGLKQLIEGFQPAE